MKNAIYPFKKDFKIYREFDIVMLPADVSKRSNCTEGLIVKCIKSWTPIGEEEIAEGKISISKNHNTGVLKYYQPQHLYVLSDESPKLEDWCYDKVLNIVFQTDEHTDFDQIEKSPYVKKVIASTDSLVAEGKCYCVKPERGGCIECEKRYPRIPQKYVEEFVEELKEDRLVTKIFLEVQGYKVKEGSDETSYKLKTNRDDMVYPLRADYNYIDLYYDTVDPELIEKDIKAICEKNINHTVLLKKVNSEDFQKPVDGVSERVRERDQMGEPEISPEEEREVFTREEVIELLASFEKLCRHYLANESWFPAKKAEWIKNNLK